MANELEELPNPDDKPWSVVTGYKRQNTNICVIQTGLDTTEPFDNEGYVIIPAGGIVEAKGVLYKISAEVILEKASPSIAYWIEIIDNGNSRASLALVTRPGTWDPSKQGCYRANGRRTLNWVSSGDLSGTAGTSASFSKTTKGKYTTPPLKKGWYLVQLASGKGGGGKNDGEGKNATNNSGGDGGKPEVDDKIEIILFHDGKKVYTGKVGGSGGSGIKGSNGSSSNSGCGGGGGCGDGEETAFENFATKAIEGGKGGKGADGNSNFNSGGNGGLPGLDGNPGGSVSNNFVTASGGDGGKGFTRFDGIPGGGGGGGVITGTNIINSGGNGGNAGLSGLHAKEDDPGGYCYIYPITE